MIEKVTWKDIEDYVDKVCKFYQNQKITGVYGIPRGGLIFSVMVSHKLNIPVLMAPIDNCIIIDDICDSGESLLHYYRNSSNPNKNKYHITTMYYKKNKYVKPELWGKEKGDKWIEFPFEKK